jgi:hypothetical protein
MASARQRQAINESITGAAWPDKQERNARLFECAQIIRALLAGETVTHRGRVTVVEARLYTRPAIAPMLVGAATSESTAEWLGNWADALITVHASPERLGKVIGRFVGEAEPESPLYCRRRYLGLPVRRKLNPKLCMNGLQTRRARGELGSSPAGRLRCRLPVCEGRRHPEVRPCFSTEPCLRNMPSGVCGNPPPSGRTATTQLY